jgi:3(or 17)beta-hydroxysteroid dehydrogenase
MARLDGKVAIVTGGAVGVGQATVELMVKEGARVVIVDLQEEKGRALAEKLGSSAMFIKADVTSEADWQSLYSQALDKFSQVNILVNNAGILMRNPIDQESLENFQKIMTVNTQSVFLGCKQAVNAMKTTGGGSIINLSSFAAIAGMSQFAAYCASKGAVASLTRSVASYCRTMKYRIRCNSVHPDGVLTDMTRAAMPAGVDAAQFTIDIDPMNRMHQPLDIANGILYLASDESRGVNGIELRIDSGQFIMGD